MLMRIRAQSPTRAARSHSGWRYGTRLRSPSLRFRHSPAAGVQPQGPIFGRGEGLSDEPADRPNVIKTTRTKDRDLDEWSRTRTRNSSVSRCCRSAASFGASAGSWWFVPYDTLSSMRPARKINLPGAFQGDELKKRAAFQTSRSDRSAARKTSIARAPERYPRPECAPERSDGVFYYTEGVFATPPKRTAYLQDRSRGHDVSAPAERCAAIEYA